MSFSHDPKNDLSPKFIFWFTFIAFFSVWMFITIMLFGDHSTPEVIYDANGIPVDYDAWREVIMRGERKDSDFPIWGRIMVSAIIGAYFIWWMLRIQFEMWVLRRASKGTNRWIDGK